MTQPIYVVAGQVPIADIPDELQAGTAARRRWAAAELRRRADLIEAFGVECYPRVRLVGGSNGLASGSGHASLVFELEDGGRLRVRLGAADMRYLALWSQIVCMGLPHEAFSAVTDGIQPLSSSQSSKSPEIPSSDAVPNGVESV